MNTKKALLPMSLLVKPHKQSFLRRQESRKTKENTGFPLKNCGNDGKSKGLLLMSSLVNKFLNNVCITYFGLIIHQYF